ncbi:class D sortase [Bacillus sp. AGMB 02131]|uniref:Class D sortase n=1 Tax=Peribacillus faecalis TaxID=2772559 RepID=A0A927H9R2_9BACI|nr:class D sortase [Peribacillus faecalis]MBD3107154.1 class D sortase [Peribacillus faecalis]
MRSTVGRVLLFLGALFICFPLFYLQKQAADIRYIEEALQLVDKGEWDAIDEEHLSIDAEELAKGIILSIPAIQLEELVLSKATKENLSVALAQIKDNQEPGQGNYTVAGHRSIVKGRHFNRLPEIKIGDVIYLKTSEEIFEYTVASKKTIEKTDVDVLADSDQIEITLITCTEDGKKRIAVKGLLSAD